MVLCCVAAVIIRKKKQRKNRISHSMFIERVRERIENEMRAEANANGNLASAPLPDHPHHPAIGEPYVMFNAEGQSVGIGGGRMRTNSRMTPIDPTPMELFMARAPPPYRENAEPESELNNPARRRNEPPPSYDSIFS